MAHEVVWLNPLLRFEGFEPRQAACARCCRTSTAFLPVHNLASLADLGRRPAATGPAPSSPCFTDLHGTQRRTSHPARATRTWAALNDPTSSRPASPAAKAWSATGDDGLLALVAVRVGPVSARFKGKLKLTDVVAPNSYTIHFDGQGGVAGFGKGSADVSLADAEASRTKLSYVARAQVGGKLAQIGSRLVDAAAGKIAEDFFTGLRRRALALPAEGAEGGCPGARAGRRHGNKMLWWICRRVSSCFGGDHGCSSDRSRSPWTAWTCRCCNRRATGAPRATPVWLVTVIETWGSAPRPPGALLAHAR
jgi:carbon monoxide dehydrogenase subunit G